MKKSLAAAVLAMVLVGAAAASAAPGLPVRASAVVLPGKPSLARGSANVRDAYRVGKGVYCVAPSPSIDWTTTAPLVAPLASRSAKGGTLIASFEAGGQRCPAAAIQVRTFRLHGARLVAADDVAFHVVVGD